MTHEERILKAKEWHEKFIVERDGYIARISELQAVSGELQDRLSAAANRLSEITNNTLYKILPSWVRDKIEAIFGG